MTEPAEGGDSDGLQSGVGVAYGGRTHNLRIHNPLLCLLS